MKKLLFLLPFVLTTVFAYPQITFEKYYTGESDAGNSVVQASDSGYVIVGNRYYGPFTQPDVYIIKTDKYGDTLWTKSIGGSLSDQGNSIAKTYDDGYIIAGGTNSYGNNGDVYLIRVNENGDTLWTRTYGGTDGDYGTCVAQTSDSGFVIFGSTSSFGIGFSIFYVIRTDRNGDTLWTRSIDYSEYGRGGATTYDGGCVIAGSTEYLSPGQCSTYLVKMNANGDTVWTKIFGISNDNGGYAVVQAKDSGFVVAGCLNTYSANGYDAFISKTDKNGNILWTKTFGGVEWEKALSIDTTSGGGYIVTGFTQISGASQFDLYLIKTDANGDSLWTKTFGGADYEEGLCVHQTMDGGYVVSGYTRSYAFNDQYPYLIKTDGNGIIAGLYPYQAKENNQIQIYPNPANGQVNIQISRQFGQTKTLEIFDRIGQLQLLKTDNFADLDISSLASGLYLIVLTNTDNQRLTSKIIKE